MTPPPKKKAISHIFVISGCNILEDKAEEIFLFSFPVSVLVKYLTLKIEKKKKKTFHMGFFNEFMDPLILERKF